MRGVNKERIAREVVRVLELVRLPGYQKRYPRQLSGGQQQRVALARALVFEPTLLLMDEPLGALDKKLREAMQLEVKHIQEQLGITVVYVTHDQEEALVMSDRIAVMRQGHIQQLADPGTLYEYPVNHFVADFIGESNFLKAKVVSIEDGIWVMETRSGLSVRTRVEREGQVGTGVEFSIRPERVVFASEGEMPNTFQGEVQEVIYIGDSVKYKIRIGADEDESLYLKQTSRSETARYRAGDQVRIGWRLQDGSLL
jgi:ABC-type Fe3+/spermidine/putrescine transport system ATPase subunit